MAAAPQEHHLCLQDRGESKARPDAISILLFSTARLPEHKREEIVMAFPGYFRGYGRSLIAEAFGFRRVDLALALPFCPLGCRTTGNLGRTKSNVKRSSKMPGNKHFLFWSLRPKLLLTIGQQTK
jgi:hypothetical protein